MEKLYQKLKENRTLENEVKYKLLVKDYKWKIKNNESEYYRKKLNEENKNPKKYWKILNNLTGLDKNTEELKIDKLIYKSKQATDNKGIANLLNDYYIEMADELMQKKGNIFIEKYDDIISIENQVQNRLIFKNTNKTEIMSIIEKMKINKKTNDKYTVKLLKEISDIISDELVYIINKSMKEGKIPLSYKESMIIPIYKKGNKEKPENYRPITIIPICSKVMEKVIFIRLLEYKNKNEIISKNQFGFRKNHNTILAVVKYIEMSYKN